MNSRNLFCAWAALVFAVPLATMGCPLFICFLVAAAIFGLGWQITEQKHDSENEIHHVFHIHLEK
jgi:flagellar biosynthesis component FlhA